VRLTRVQSARSGEAAAQAQRAPVSAGRYAAFKRFVAAAEDQLKPTILVAYVSCACTAAKLTGVWLHDLRRSFVTNARRRGVPESVVMKMSGHRTRAVFDRYNIIEEHDLREAVKRLEAGVAKRSGGSGQDLDKVDGKGA